MLNKPFVVCIFFCLLGILTYFPSFFGSFVWDDYDFIVDNQYVTTNRIDKFFTAQAVEGTGRISNYYRPIQFTLYAVTYRLFGTNPHAFHALSIAFHIGASVMVFYFLRSLSVTHLLSFLIAILFLIHPLQTEAVSYISGLSDPLVGFFGFATLVSFLKKHYAWSILLFLLTLLSKESGLIFLGILLMLVLMYRKKETLPIVFLFCLIALLYVTYHKTVIHIIDMRTVFGDSPYTYSVFVRLSTFLSILPSYLSLIVFPKNLFYDRDFFVKILSTLWHLPSFIVLGLMITMSSIVLRRKKPMPIISFFSFFIALLPFSGIVLINGIMYEHFLYLALPFFYLFIFSWFDKRHYSRRFFILVCILSTLLITRSWIRQHDWQDPIRFSMHTLSYVPNSFRALNNLGMEYMRQGKYSDAIQAFQRAVWLHPKLSTAYHNIGTVFFNQQNYPAAERYFLKAVHHDPNFGYSYHSLLKLYQETNQKEKLQKLLEAVRRKFQ